MAAAAAKISVDIRTYDHEVKSMTQAFLAEIAGALNVFSEDVAMILRRKYLHEFGSADIQPDELARAQHSVIDMLCAVFKLRTDLVPSDH